MGRKNCLYSPEKRKISYKCLGCRSHSQVKVCCNGDSLRAGKSRWQVDYRVSDRQQDGKVARF